MLTQQIAFMNRMVALQSLTFLLILLSSLPILPPLFFLWGKDSAAAFQDLALNLMFSLPSECWHLTNGNSLAGGGR